MVHHGGKIRKIKKDGVIFEVSYGERKWNLDYVRRGVG